MNNVDRAKQFMPFASLKGYEKLIRQKEREITEKKELNVMQLAHNNLVMSTLKKGDEIMLEFYFVDDYIKKSGKVRRIDKVLKTLQLDGIEINFDDILKIDIINN